MILKTKLTQAEYDEIEALVDQALSAPNKASAKKYIDRLAFLARDFEGPAHNKLSELCAYVKNASGRVADKDRKESFCKMDLFTLRNFIEK